MTRPTPGITALLVLGLWSAAVPPLRAFGVEPAENGLGSEHERITRAAIGDMEPGTLDRLAGRDGEPGAVGAPDVPGSGPSSHAAAHCEGGDYLEPAAGEQHYAQSAEAARAALTACRAFMFQELERAVAAAKPLSNPAASDTALACGADDDDAKGAKCRVVEHLGIAFHAAQDFYAHTNWVDQPAVGPAGAKNPPGLAKKGRAWWLDPRTTKAPFPNGLISSCEGGGDGLGLTSGCEYGDWSPVFGAERVMRADLGKGFGPIGGGVGGTGTTRRGAINGNFRRAVALAVEDTRDKWDYFKERVRAVYPGTPGETILCAISSDAFDKAKCAARAGREMVCAARRAFYVDETASELYPLFEPRAEEMSEAERLWEPLRPYCRLEEALLARDAVVNGGAAEHGRALGKTRAVAALGLWNACPAEAKSRLELLRGQSERLLPAADEVNVNRKKVKNALAAQYADCIVAARIRQLGK